MPSRERNLRRILVASTCLGLAFATGAGCEAAPQASAPTTAVVNRDFLTSAECARCHSHSPDANALTTASGDDASPHGLWQATPMANSFRDPYWRAQMAREIERAPASRKMVEDLCLRCHAPMAVHAAALADRAPPTMESLRDDPLARDGVSCALCHQIQPEELGKAASFSGHATIRGEKRIFGPFENPTVGPMRMNTGYTPTAAAHISASALCGTCHTLYTSTPAGTAFLEQAPYLEWRNSVYSDESGASDASRTCQACHMPDQGTMKIARMPTGFDFNIAIRERVRGHVLVGGNAWLIDLLRLNREELGVVASDASLLRTAAATRSQLAFSTARLSIEGVERQPNGLRFDLHVQNLAGHKLPSGYPARRAWLEVELRAGRTVLFSSGATDEAGRFLGVADELDIPHYDRIERPNEVAVYEMVALDAQGRPTTSVIDMTSMKKDTRLLPRGWRADGPHAQETAPVGVQGDADFTDGGDRVNYDIRFSADQPGPLTLVTWLRYQPIPPAWVEPLRASRTAEAKDFVRMLDAAKFQPETIALAIQIID
ncbi:MAG TPA: multiheme c-type cytochrome [Planctomycetota bacterium]|nr:multiheme c-type cytochrome [Planctomycetota bacterium]